MHAIMEGSIKREDVELFDDEPDILDQMQADVDMFTLGEPFEKEKWLELIDDDFKVLTAGTADVIQVLDDRVKVLDYKTGRVWVAPDSLQIKAYAVCAMQTYSKPVAEVAISQPRAGGMKPAMFSDFDALYAEVSAVITACDAENPVFMAGAHCRYCPGRMTCTVRATGQEATVALAEVHNALMTPQNVGMLARQAQLHKKVCDDIITKCKELTLAGEDTGFKVIEKQGRASISDPAQAVARVGSVLPQEEIVSGAVSLSLSKLKKMYANKLKESGLKTKKEAEEELENLLADVITRGKPTQTMVEDKGKTK
jgi:hypothetical protein